MKFLRARHHGTVASPSFRPAGIAVLDEHRTPYGGTPEATGGVTPTGPRDMARLQTMMIVRSDQVPASGFAKAFVGEAYGVGASFLIIEAKPGEGPATHSHSYPEVIIIQRGQARCVVGDMECVAHAGDVIFIAANEPHSFINSGNEPLMQIDIHLSERFATQWLDSGGT